MARNLGNVAKARLQRDAGETTFIRVQSGEALVHARTELEDNEVAILLHRARILVAGIRGIEVEAPDVLRVEAHLRQQVFAHRRGVDQIETRAALVKALPRVPAERIRTRAGEVVNHAGIHVGVDARAPAAEIFVAPGQVHARATAYGGLREHQADVLARTPEVGVGIADLTDQAALRVQRDAGVEEAGRPLFHNQRDVVFARHRTVIQARHDVVEPAGGEEVFDALAEFTLVEGRTPFGATKNAFENALAGAEVAWRFVDDADFAQLGFQHANGESLFHVTVRADLFNLNAVTTGFVERCYAVGNGATVAEIVKLAERLNFGGDGGDFVGRDLGVADDAELLDQRVLDDIDNDVHLAFARGLAGDRDFAEHAQGQDQIFFRSNFGGIKGSAHLESHRANDVRRGEAHVALDLDLPDCGIGLRPRAHYHCQGRPQGRRPLPPHHCQYGRFARHRDTTGRFVVLIPAARRPKCVGSNRCGTATAGLA